MYRLSFLFLFQCVLVGKLVGQNSFDQQHEKFIRLHRDEDPVPLLEVLQLEEQLIRQKNPKLSNSQRAKLALDRGIYFYLIDDYPKCIASFERAEKLKDLMLGRDKILLYTYLGVSYRNGEEDYVKSNRYLDRAIALAEKEIDCDLLASAVLKKGFNYYSQNEYAQGVRFIESFFQKKRKELTLKRKISFHGILGQGYDKLGNFTKSYSNYTAAIELAEKTKDVRLIADRNYDLIGYFLSKDRYSDAKIQTLHVIGLVKDKPELEEILHDCYGALSQIYPSLNELDSALYYAELSHKYALKTGDEESLAISTGALGNVYYEKDDYEKALGYMLKSLEYEEQIVGIKGLIETYHNIGAVYIYLKNYPQAISYFNKSKQQAYREGDIYSVYVSYRDLVEVYRESGNFERAITMSDSTFVYYDSLNNMEKNKELLQLEVQYKTKFKDQENKLLKLEVKRQKEAGRDILLLGIGVILLLLGVVYVLYIKNRLKKSKVTEADAKIQNQKLEEELLVQRLSLLTEEINRKNKLIQSLENGANSVAEESLLNKVTLENDWLAFMSEFDKIHNGYLAELKRQFPDLTTNNLRLAAVVKLEFSNKEIANILSITENGVKKAKQRLKERIKMD